MNRRAPVRLALGALLASVAVACSSSPIELGPRDSTPTPTGGSSASSAGGATTSVEAGASTTVPVADLDVTIDLASRGAAISEHLTGISGTYPAEDMARAGIGALSFGGNPSTRFNYEIGHAWNHGSDFEFRNTNYEQPTGDAVRNLVTAGDAAGALVRVAVPTLGWVASNDDPDTCSFPTGDGGCESAADVGTCRDDGPIADPTLANVTSTPEQVSAWMAQLVADGLEPDVIAMDNEPELWGVTHYDVHPKCSTYEEILAKYLTYATAMRAVAPDAQLAGPVVCCWYDYWDQAPGPDEGDFEEYLDWFLRSVKAEEERTGLDLLDVLDVHYYPQSNVFNDDTDADTNARRLRSTRSLWDPFYKDESWIDDQIAFLPRMRETIARNDPGLPLLISEWNFGADSSVNGALAIAEVLAIYGREGVWAANYWFQPAVDSPGYMAFKMHGNYDDEGSRFGGDVVTTTSSDANVVSAFGAVDDAGTVRLMLINKDPDAAHAVALSGLDAAGTARAFTYGESTSGAITHRDVDVAAAVSLPASSITVLEVAPR